MIDFLLFLFSIFFLALLSISLLFLLSQYLIRVRGIKDQSYHLLHDAQTQAQTIIGQSELEGIKMAADSRLNIGKFEKQTEDSLTATSEEAKERMQKAEEAFRTYLTNLSQQANASVVESEQVTRSRINTLFEEFEQNISTYLTQTQQQSVKAINLEVAAARQLVETYKTEQFRLIDENIVAMLEKTLSLVLIKKLSLKDHVELVYESLERAKAEKFII